VYDWPLSYGSCVRFLATGNCWIFRELEKTGCGWWGLVWLVLDEREREGGREGGREALLFVASGLCALFEMLLA